MPSIIPNIRICEVGAINVAQPKCRSVPSALVRGVVLFRVSMGTSTSRADGAAKTSVH